MSAINWVEIVKAISAALEQHRDDLNALDAELGDGDHGTGISTAFSQAAQEVAGLTEATPTAVLKTVAMTLMNRMGGSSGALYGTLFLRASAAAPAERNITPTDFAAMWSAGLEGVRARGKANPGDKTMVDALAPAVAALNAAASNDEPLARAIAAAAEAARAGAEKTAGMVAHHGRARFVGERALGHRDAGATSIALMFEAIARYVERHSI